MSWSSAKSSASTSTTRFILDGRFDITRRKPLARCGYQDYAVVEAVFALARPA